MIGKLIVATDEDQVAAYLENIRLRARANGVEDLEFLSGNEVTALEPELRCVTALISPSSNAAWTATVTCSLCRVKPRTMAR